MKLEEFMEYEPGKSVTVNIVCCALIALMLLTLFFGWVGVSERGKLYWAEFRDNFDYVTDSLEDELEDYDVSSDTQNKLIKSVNSFRDGKLSPIEALSILISTKAAIKEVGEYLGPEEAQNAILGITAITAVFAAVIILIVERIRIFVVLILIVLIGSVFQKKLIKLIRLLFSVSPQLIH